DTARKDAQNILVLLDQFKPEQSKLNDPLTVARLAAELSSLVDVADAAKLVGATDALETALSKEPSYQQFIKQKQENEQKSRMSALIAASGEAKRLKAFIEDYVSSNLTGAGVGELLDEDTSLATALNKNALEDLVETNAGATAEIKK